MPPIPRKQQQENIRSRLPSRNLLERGQGMGTGHFPFPVPCGNRGFLFDIPQRIGRVSGRIDVVYQPSLVRPTANFTETGVHIPTVVEIKFQTKGGRCYATTSPSRQRPRPEQGTPRKDDYGAHQSGSEHDCARHRDRRGLAAVYLDNSLGTQPGHGTMLMIFVMSPDGEVLATARDSPTPASQGPTGFSKASR